MTEAVAAPTERLAGRVVIYWLLSDGLSAAFVTGLAWFVGRPLLAEHWDSWSIVLERILLGVCIGFVALAFLSAPLAFLRWRFGFLGGLLLMR